MVQLKPLREKYIQVVVETTDKLLEFGRQCVGESPPLSILPSPDGQRLVIAELQNVTLGRQQLRAEVLNSNTVQLTNLSKKIVVNIDGKELLPDGSARVQLPVDVRMGDIQLRIETVPAGTVQYQTLLEPPSVHRKVGAESSVISHSLRASLANSDHQSLLYRLEQLVQVLQASASSPDFMDRIVSASVEMIELDHAAVILWDGNAWKPAAIANASLAQKNDDWSPSRSLLNQMRSSRRTTWSSPQQNSMVGGGQASLVDVVAFVAAPIMNPQGEVIGAVYGDRRSGIGGMRKPIEQMDAQLVEILACGIAGGLQRVENEREILVRRLQFEQFVTAEVANKIEQDPDSLTGRDADVTMLFCDIAGFSRISEPLPPNQTFEWINDVMLTLSECVKQHGGTIVDYVGDEIIAMWGAPFPVEQHAPAACRAAIDMIESLPKIDAKWQSVLKAPTAVGVGINSGKVRVGNTGCQLKLKYGPLGSTVNIASRVQGATRFLRTPILISGATAELLGGQFPVRRLCQLRVKNIVTPIDIFELPVTSPADWAARCASYSVALKAWENGRLQEAIRLLSQIVATHNDDVPALVMLSRAIEAWSLGHSEHDPVWTLPSK